MKYKIRKLSFILLLLIINKSGWSCINEYRALLDGSIVETGGFNGVPAGIYDNVDKQHLLKLLYKSDSTYKASGKTEDYSDYGAMLVYNGVYDEAKEVFQNIEVSSPGLYATASNLGTVYELLGENDSAYFWISKAIKLNPNSHEGSEWIHLKILEAKIKSKGIPDYFVTHSILSLNFGDKEKPENLSNIDLELLRTQLYYQLNERITFVKPKDLIVGQLLFDLGNINAITIDVKAGIKAYELAKKYGYKSTILSKREKHFESLQSKAELKDKVEGWLIDNLAAVGITVLICLILIAIFIMKRIKSRRSEK